MFSSVVTPDSRILRVFRLTEAGEEPLAPPAGQTRRIAATLTSPSEDRLRELAVKFLAFGWADETVKPTSIRVEVWEEKFDPLRMTLTAEPLLEVEVERPIQ
jgi:hypothetical protein